MKFSQQAISAALAAAAVLAHSISALPLAQAAPLAADSQSPAPPLPALSSSAAPSYSATHGLVTGLYRRIIEPVSATIGAVGFGVAGVMGVKNLAEAHHRNRKAAQKFVEEAYKDEYERNKEKDTKRVNHYEEHPSKGCYSVCGGQKKLSPADCSKGKFRSELSLYRRTIQYLFEDDDALDESDLDEDEAVDIDEAVEDALKRSPLSSQSPLRPYQKKTLERTSTTPKRYTGAPAKSSESAPSKTPTTGEASSEADASVAPSKKMSSPWNPFKSKAPNADVVKHVQVGGGLINKFRTAEKMRSSAQKKIDAQVNAGGCAVVHNKINGQHGL